MKMGSCTGQHDARSVKIEFSTVILDSRRTGMNDFTAGRMLGYAEEDLNTFALRRRRPKHKVCDSYVGVA